MSLELVLWVGNIVSLVRYRIWERRERSLLLLCSASELFHRRVSRGSGH